MTIRPPAVSGSFYPADPTLLSWRVDEMLASHSDIPLTGRLRALIAPHAGYAYSGDTAAAAYALLPTRRFTRVIVIAPSHREYFNGMSIYDGDAYRTPLGLVEIDRGARDSLLGFRGVFMKSRFGHRDEHAVEVHLPFLQRTLGDFSFVPIVMGDQRREHCMLLGAALAELIDDETLIVASSDLSHMLPDELAHRVDAITADDIVEGSAARLFEDLDAHRAQACGGGPIVAVLHGAAMRGTVATRVLHQCTSGDVTGVRDSVVGYLSAAITTS